MLILVGVSVSVAINGGLFSTAKKAVTKTEEAKDSELRFMAMAKAATHDKEWVYEVEEEKIPIPAGFAPTEIEGENSLEEGLVIIDVEGNEFVWIPCTKGNYEDANFDNNWTQTNYSGGTWTDDQVEKVGKVSLGKLEQRYKTGELTKQGVGFYVARYEAGIPENAPFYPKGEEKKYIIYEEGTETTDTKNSIRNTNKYTPVSKKGYPAWNFINQTNAKTVSENMYSGMSYLIDSHAWNYICQNILDGKAGKNITSCSNWGNYRDNKTTKYENLDVLYAVHERDSEDVKYTTQYHKGLIPNEARTGNNRLELATGASEDFMGYNIYDMAGNVWDRTTEMGTNSYRTSVSVLRGGGFKNAGVHDAPVVRASAEKAPDWCSERVGFRVVLYL